MVVKRNQGEREPVETNSRLSAIGSVLLSKFQRFEKTDQSLHDHYTWIDGDLTFAAANTRGKETSGVGFARASRFAAYCRSTSLPQAVGSATTFCGSGKKRY
jgi:hypothetical protein